MSEDQKTPPQPQMAFQELDAWLAKVERLLGLGPAGIRQARSMVRKSRKSLGAQLSAARGRPG